MTCSTLLLVRSRRRCGSAKANTVKPSGKFSSSQAASFGADVSYFCTVRFSSAPASALSCALKTARMSAATCGFMSCLGAWAEAFC